MSRRSMGTGSGRHHWGGEEHPFLVLCPCSVSSLNKINLVISTKYIHHYLCQIPEFPKLILISYPKHSPNVVFTLYDCYICFWHSFATTLTLICLVFTQYTIGFISGGTSKRTFAVRTWKRGETCRAKRCTMARLMMGT